MTENMMYFGLAYHSGGAADVGSLFVIRCLVNGLGHAVWTSFTGAAIGWSRGRHGRGILRFLVLPVGWGLAVLGHATWNAGASLAIGFLTIGFSYNWLLSDWQALIIAGVVGGLPFTIPPILIAFIIARLGLEQEEYVVRTYLPIEVGLGTLTPAEAAALASRAARNQQERDIRLRKGEPAAQNQIAFNIAATQLAFFHYHALRGERPDRADVRRAEQLRWQIATLRWYLTRPG